MNSRSHDTARSERHPTRGRLPGIQMAVLAAILGATVFALHPAFHPDPDSHPDCPLCELGTYVENAPEPIIDPYLAPPSALIVLAWEYGKRYVSQIALTARFPRGPPAATA